ncbi:PASTA domain-containing protein [Aliiroseovarius sp. Z3]|nr:PASTA domain-containing protein [Aliiroseovarius sp. Z3]
MRWVDICIEWIILGSKRSNVFVFLLMLCWNPTSSWAEQVTIPNVIGSTREQARLSLKNSGLLYEIEDFQGCPKQRGTVTFQNPEAGTVVDLPYEVFMRTNTLELLEVPQVGNRSHTQYASFLRDQGINSQVESQYIPIRGPCPLIRETVERFVGTRPEPGAFICQNESLTILVERREFGDACHGRQTRNGCICF